MAGLGATQRNDSESAVELEHGPLIEPLSPAVVGKVIAGLCTVILVLSWCMLDNWNEVVIGSLFKMGVADGTEESHGTPQYFKSPLTLTFLQLAFMSCAFFAIWYATSKDREQELLLAKIQIFSAPWPVLVATHLFSMFWLQALMMPSQVMTIGYFAATRAAEVPLAAWFRGQALGQPSGGHSIQVITAVCVANLVLFYSYLKMEGCMCIFEGHGVFLDGLAMYGVFFMLLALPALNSVCQESMMTKWRMNPLLMLALQNGFACALFSPMLLLENVQRALGMIFQFEEVALLVLWICLQATAFAFVTVLLIRSLDSFWAVALRSMRVVYWWSWQLLIFYVGSNELLSISHPKISGWSFGMVSGLCVLAFALFADKKIVKLVHKATGGRGQRRGVLIAEESDDPAKRV